MINEIQILLGVKDRTAKGFKGLNANIQKSTALIKSYKAQLMRLHTVVPKNQQQQAAWVGSLNRTRQALIKTSPEFAGFSQSFKNVENAALKSSKSLAQAGTGINKIGKQAKIATAPLTGMGAATKAYKKDLDRLNTQVPLNTEEQKKWSNNLQASGAQLQKISPGMKGFGAQFKSVEKQALMTNNKLVETNMMMGRTAQSTRGITGKMHKFADSLLGPQRDMYSLGRAFNHYLPIAFVMIYSIKRMTDFVNSLTQSFADFEKELITVERTTGMSHDAIVQMGKALIGVSTISVATVADLEKIAITAGRMGITGSSAILNFTDAIVKMANATILTADQAALNLAKISKAFQLPEESILNLGSMIDTLANTAAANAEEISTAMKRAAGAAKVMDIPVEALAAMGTTLIESGEQAARAGTRIGRAFVYMAVKTSVMARQMSMTTQQLGERMEEDMLEVIKDYLLMLRATPSKVDRIAKAHEVFGMIGTKAITKLANNYDMFEKHLEDAHEDMLYGITLEREYAKTLGTTSAEIQILDNQIEALKIQMGKGWAPVTIKMKEIVKDFYKILAGPEPYEFGVVITGINDDLETYLSNEKTLIEVINDSNKSIYTTTELMHLRTDLMEDDYKQRGKEIPLTLKATKAMAWMNRNMIVSEKVTNKVGEALGYNLQNVLDTGDANMDAADKLKYHNAMVERAVSGMTKISAKTKQLTALSISLVKSQIEQGTASDILIDKFEGLGDVIKKKNKLIKELSNAHLKYGDISEWVIDIEGDLAHSMRESIIAGSDVIDMWNRLYASQKKSSDMLAFARGEIDYLPDSLLRIGDAIWPMEILAKGFIEMEDVIDKGMLDPMKETATVADKVEKASIKLAKVRELGIDEDITKAQEEFNNIQKDYFNVLSKNMPTIHEYTKYIHETDLALIPMYKNLLNVAQITEEEMKLYEGAPATMSQYIGMLGNIEKIKTKLVDVEATKTEAEELWIKAISESNKEGTNTISILNDILKVKDESLVLTEDEITALKESMKVATDAGKTKEETNIIMKDEIALLLYRKRTGQEITSLNVEEIELRKEINQLSLDGLQVLVDQGLITGKVADDINLMNKSLNDLKNISAEETEEMYNMLDSFILMVDEAGGIDTQIKKLNEMFGSFGMTFVATGSEAEGWGIKMTDVMGNVEVQSRHTTDTILSNSNDANAKLEKIWEGFEEFGIPSKMLEFAFSGDPMYQMGKMVLTGMQQLGVLEQIRDNLLKSGTSESTLGEMQHGGYINQTGLYKLHEGENVTPAGEGAIMNISIGSVNLSPDYPAQRFLEDLEHYRFAGI